MADVTTAAFLSIHNMCAWMIDAFGAEELRKASCRGWPHGR